MSGQLQEEQHPGAWPTKLKSFLFPTQGTTVRIITAIDQDKGRPRGIGYTIVSGKAWGALVPHPYSRRATLGVSGSVGVWDSGCGCVRARALDGVLSVCLGSWPLSA